MLYSKYLLWRAPIAAVLELAAACNEPADSADAGLSTAVQAVTGVNEAPVLDATKSPELLTEFSGAPAASVFVGTRVALLVDWSQSPTARRPRRRSRCRVRTRAR